MFTKDELATRVVVVLVDDEDTGFFSTVAELMEANGRDDQVATAIRRALKGETVRVGGGAAVAFAISKA
jgi:hypothetical protein